MLWHPCNGRISRHRANQRTRSPTKQARWSSRPRCLPCKKRSSASTLLRSVSFVGHPARCDTEAWLEVVCFEERKKIAPSPRCERGPYEDHSFARTRVCPASVHSMLSIVGRATAPNIILRAHRCLVSRTDTKYLSYLSHWSMPGICSSEGFVQTCLALRASRLPAPFYVEENALSGIMPETCWEYFAANAPCRRYHSHARVLSLTSSFFPACPHPEPHRKRSEIGNVARGGELNSRPSHGRARGTRRNGTHGSNGVQR